MIEVPRPPRPRPGGDVAVVTGVAAFSAFGRGTPPLMAAALDGTSAFTPVDRFEVGERRVRDAATAPGDPVLADELVAAIGDACDQAGLTSAQRGSADLLMALHGDPDLARTPPAERDRHSTVAYARRVADAAGISGTIRPYTSACVAASTALADAAAMVTHGRAERVVVAAGYLVEPDQFALFDAGRALATDGRVRPFSADRTGILLGDGVGAVVIESATAAARRGAGVLARLSGWGRAGDAHHVVAPRPDGAGLATAIGVACRRAGITPDALGYINAHGSGTTGSDISEAAALGRALNGSAATTPISSTKSIHGQALEASSLLEFIVTVLAMRSGALPVNAGFLGPDVSCPLNVVVAPATATIAYAMSINSAFGGAHTALIVGAP
jgi:3-oxoacyl-[acyl-carrier-protein] synthase II